MPTSYYFQYVIIYCRYTIPIYTDTLPRYIPTAL